MRKLIRLQYLQFKRSTSKMEVFGRIYVLACIWLMELVGIHELRDGLEELSLQGVARPLVLIGICLGVGIADAVYKLVFKHDATVMDAFLKTRPIPSSLWERYLVVSQLWHPDNLMMPLLMLPACFAIFHFGWGLIAFLVLYLLSVAGGIFFMEAKRGRNYDEGGRASKKHGRRSFGHNSVFGLHVLSTVRSHRLRTAMLVLVGVFSINIFTQRDVFSMVMVLFVMMCAPMTIGQYGFGIEANFFNAIWTKPLPIRRVLTEKYYFLGVLAICTAMFLAVVCLICRIPMLTLAGCLVFVVGMSNLLILLDACNATRFDLFGKAFFNYQGSASTFRPVMFLVIFLSMGLGAVPLCVFDGWVQFAVLSGMGVLGFVLHWPVFKWVESRFLKNRYEYMDKYSK